MTGTRIAQHVSQMVAEHGCRSALVVGKRVVDDDKIRGYLLASGVSQDLGAVGSRIEDGNTKRRLEMEFTNSSVNVVGFEVKSWCQGVHGELEWERRRFHG